MFSVWLINTSALAKFVTIDTSEVSATSGSVAQLSQASVSVADIWDALAADYNDAGTMGQLLNSSGGAADPLLNEVPGSYAQGTAGYAISDVSTINANIDKLFKVVQAGGN